MMSATKADHCRHCGREVDLAGHFVYERVPVISSVDGSEFTLLKVHPCVFKFEETYHYGPISKKDIEDARIACTTHRSTSNTYSTNSLEAAKKALSPKRKKRSV